MARRASHATPAAEQVEARHAICASGNPSVTSHIQATVVGMIARGAKLRDTIEGRFALASKRLPCRGENLDELRRLHALIDGETARGAQDELRLQVFTNGVTRQIHFEIAQCAGLKGLSEGSLRTLFEGTELDQKRRGILRDTSAARASL